MPPEVLIRINGIRTLANCNQLLRGTELMTIPSNVSTRTKAFQGKITQKATRNGPKRILCVVVPVRNGPQVEGSAILMMANVPGGKAGKISLTSRERCRRRLRECLKGQHPEPGTATATNQERSVPRRIA